MTAQNVNAGELEDNLEISEKVDVVPPHPQSKDFSVFKLFSHQLQFFLFNSYFPRFLQFH